MDSLLCSLPNKHLAPSKSIRISVTQIRQHIVVLQSVVAVSNRLLESRNSSLVARHILRLLGRLKHAGVRRQRMEIRIHSSSSLQLLIDFDHPLVVFRAGCMIRLELEEQQSVVS